MIGFGNDELKGKREVHAGDMVKHKCGEFHELMPATNASDGTPDTSLLYVLCKGTPYLAAIDNRLVLEEG